MPESIRSPLSLRIGVHRLPASADPHYPASSHGILCTASRTPLSLGQGHLRSSVASASAPPALQAGSRCQRGERGVTAKPLLHTHSSGLRSEHFSCLIRQRRIDDRQVAVL